METFWNHFVIYHKLNVSRKLKCSFSEKATKICAFLPHGFDIYLVNVKTMRKIVQIFVAFSEKLNFKVPEVPVEVFLNRIVKNH